MRKYPEPSDYQAAIQNPQLVFRQPELQACRVRADRLGLPAVSSGGFALSFYLQAPGGEQWVVRCFKTDSPDRRARYDAISRFLNAHPDPLLLDVDYYEQGILVDGTWYPVVKMPLVRGVTLQRHIEHELAQGRSTAHLSLKFRAAVRKLEQLGIAHGDLQHGNIMVQQGELVLVDYDGMYVPDLHGWPPAEIGSADYQHPLRKRQFGPDLDRFSAIVIDLALQSLAIRPDLWAKYNTGDNLLFRRADFRNPQASALLAELEQIPQLRAPSRSLRAICQAPFEATPPLPSALAAPALPGALAAGRAGDIDAQLNKLYAAWSPAPANPAPVAAAAAPVSAESAPGRPVEVSDWARVGGLLRQMVQVAWLAGILGWGVVASISTMLNYASAARPLIGMTPTPAVVQQVTADDLRTQTATTACPDDLYVSLIEPRQPVTTDIVTFAWRSSQELTSPCRFQLKVWRADNPSVVMDVRNSYRRVGTTYLMSVHLPNSLPLEAEKAGTFYWTVELGMADGSSDPIPAHSIPLKFFWDPL